MKTIRARAATILAAGIAAGIAATTAPAWGSLILEYKFNETGTTAPSTGGDSSAGATATLLDAAGAATDLHGVDGSGVSGLPGDRAFNNTASTGMGNSGTGGIALVADNDNVDELASFTLSGWFKTAGTTALTNFARLFEDEVGGAGYHLLAGDAAGEFRPQVDGNELPDISGWGDTQKWVFFAMTYDGTQSTDNLLLYKGYRNDAEAGGGVGSANVELIATRTIDAGQVEGNTSPLQMGNRADRARPFDGFLDNMRIDGSATDATGALTITDLETRRAADVVPEPASALLALAGGTALLLRRRR